MGKLVNGINGPFVGKVGNIIGSSWRGIPYIKSRGLRTKPPTEGEKLNRFIFKETQEWLYPLTHFLRVGFKGYTLKSQGVNAAKSYLYKNALIKNGYDTVIDPSLMKVSYGTLSLSNELSVELNQEEEKLVFTWDPKIREDQNRDDQVMLLAYDIENQVTAMTTSGQFRHTGSDILDLSYLPMRTFVVYAAFVSVDRESQSDSVYLGTFTLKNAKNTPVKTVIKRKLDKEGLLHYTVVSTDMERPSVEAETAKTVGHGKEPAGYGVKNKLTKNQTAGAETPKDLTKNRVVHIDEIVPVLGRKLISNTENSLFIQRKETPK